MAEKFLTVVSTSCPRLLINREKVGIADRLSRFLGLSRGLVFDPKDSKSGRDVAWLGQCDAGCQMLADKLGWGDELKSLIQREHKSLDEEAAKESKELKESDKFKETKDAEKSEK